MRFETARNSRPNAQNERIPIVFPYYLPCNGSGPPQRWSAACARFFHPALFSWPRAVLERGLLQEDVPRRHARHQIFDQRIFPAENPLKRKIPSPTLPSLRQPTQRFPTFPRPRCFSSLLIDLNPRANSLCCSSNSAEKERFPYGNFIRAQNEILIFGQPKPGSWQLHSIIDRSSVLRSPGADGRARPPHLPHHHGDSGARGGPEPVAVSPAGKTAGWASKPSNSQNY